MPDDKGGKLRVLGAFLVSDFEKLLTERYNEKKKCLCLHCSKFLRCNGSTAYKAVFLLADIVKCYAQRVG